MRITFPRSKHNFSGKLRNTIETLFKYIFHGPQGKASIDLVPFLFRISNVFKLQILLFPLPPWQRIWIWNTCFRKPTDIIQLGQLSVCKCWRRRETSINFPGNSTLELTIYHFFRLYNVPVLKSAEFQQKIVHIHILYGVMEVFTNLCKFQASSLVCTIFRINLRSSSNNYM